MFTGIITHQGRVRSIGGSDEIHVDIEPGFATEDLVIGASVAHSGVCLTVVAKSAHAYRLDATPETMARTTIGQWREGSIVNIERSLRLGDELGGHLVFGHVDGIGRVREVRRLADDSWLFGFDMPAELAPMVAVKGSIAVDGISLTVTEAGDTHFAVCVIPHTYAMTTLHQRQVGDLVNLEVDMLARYVARQLGGRR